MPLSNFDGVSQVMLKVVDPDGNYGLTTFKIKLMSVNDPPVIEFRRPLEGATVSKIVEIGGFAEDIEGSPVYIQLKIGSNTPDNPWLDISNEDGYWSYLFDSNEFTEPTGVMVYCRAFDS